MSLAAEQHLVMESSTFGSERTASAEPGTDQHTGSKASAEPLFDLENANAVYAKASSLAIIKHALANATRPVISTSFSAHSAVLLHQVLSVQPNIVVLWCDTGFNTPATYKFADQLTNDLGLNLKIYQPRLSAAHLQARYHGIPDAETVEHGEFSNIVKIEPFARAFAELQPDLWITGIRSEETEFRKTQDIFTWDASRQVTKVAPTFYSATRDLVAYLDAHNLPSEVDYFDPTKPEEHLECGLHF